MAEIHFKAVSLCNELNLNHLGRHFGFSRKFQWDEPLYLSSKQLDGIVRFPQDKSLYIFSFGSIVFLNFAHHEMADFINYLKKIEKDILNTSLDYFDDYNLEVDPQKEFSINYDRMTLAELKDFHADIISTVLAKSTALDKIEDGINKLLDDIEDIIYFLEQGHLNISDERLARISGKILSFKYNTISYVMLLDKPNITWINEESQNLYNELEKLFELRDRYEKIRHKTETLLDITDVFTGLAHAKRGTRLEWMVIILIFTEILLSIIMYIWK
ncbi:MAG: required for meiotic nuclear division protein 1 [Tepidanaerobacteraceae bacterium]|nr:required for meiotic nuclear division protein 1 [Tepidanaerobacteraceae bacterium]